MLRLYARGRLTGVRAPVVACLAALALVGCHSGKQTVASAATPSTATLSPSAPADPNEALRSELSSGIYQLGATLDSVQAALEQAKTIDKDAKADFKQAMDDIVDRLNSCGSTLADYNDEPPSLETVAKDFKKYDDQRLKAIDDVNDTVTELKEIKGMVSGVAGTSDATEDQLTKLAALVDQALEDASGTLDALGGKVQLPTPEAPDPTATPS